MDFFSVRETIIDSVTRVEGCLMEKQIAEKINKKLMKSVRIMNEAAGLIRNNCSDTERRKHFEPISQAMALLFDELDLIYEEHPNLKPEEYLSD